LTDGEEERRGGACRRLTSLALLAPRRATIAVAVVLATSVALFGVLAPPNPPSLSTNVTGNAALAAQALPHLDGALDRVSIAIVDGTTVTAAGRECQRRDGWARRLGQRRPPGGHQLRCPIRQMDDDLRLAMLVQTTDYRQRLPGQ
jgi:hypothetical protein